MPARNWKIDGGALHLLTAYNVAFIFCLFVFSCLFVVFVFHGLKSREAVNRLCSILSVLFFFKGN